MTTCVDIIYREDSTSLCLQTVINPASGNYVTGFGPGPEMTWWLIQHGYHGCRTIFDGVDQFYPEGLEVEFQDPAVALLFKLTWG